MFLHISSPRCSISSGTYPKSRLSLVVDRCHVPGTAMAAATGGCSLAEAAHLHEPWPGEVSGEELKSELGGGSNVFLFLLLFFVLL